MKFIVRTDAGVEEVYCDTYRERGAYTVFYDYQQPTGVRDVAAFNTEKVVGIRMGPSHTTREESR